jgi:hypothetical protein
MRWSAWFGIVLIFATRQALAADLCDNWPDTKCVSFPALNAATIALLQFQKDQPKADRKNFFVLIREFDLYFEIEFVPRQTPPKSDGSSVSFDSPHGNEHGQSVGYDISKKDDALTKKFFSR